jgi:ATP phosphoribosyltransferase regulatory subunit HisZ
MASGGRYDELLGRFDCGLPAAGFALDLDRVGEALRAAGVAGQARNRVVVLGAPAWADARASELRTRGIPAVCADATDREGALAWARAWGFTHVLDGSKWVDAASGATIGAPES